MSDSLAYIDTYTAEQLLGVHNDLEANFNDIVSNVGAPRSYQGLFNDISQADDILNKAGSALLTRLLSEKEVEGETLKVRRGAFAILKNLTFLVFIFYLKDIFLAE